MKHPVKKRKMASHVQVTLIGGYPVQPEGMQSLLHQGLEALLTEVRLE